MFVEMLKCSCYLNKANVKYLKESLAKHEKLFNTWKFLLFKMTSLGTKFPLYWWTSYKWSIFFVFLLYVLWEMILVGGTFPFLLVLLLKWHSLFHHYNILFDCTLFIWSLTLCILFHFRTCQKWIGRNITFNGWLWNTYNWSGLILNKFWHIFFLFWDRWF